MNLLYLMKKEIFYISLKSVTPLGTNSNKTEYIMNIFGSDQVGNNGLITITHLQTSI